MSCSVTSCSRREVCHTNVCSSVFVLSQPRFEVTDIKGPLVCHSSRVLDRLCYSSQVSNGPCYSSQINQCYSSILFRRQQENPSLRHESTSIQRPKEKSTPERERERERERAPFGSSFYVFFFPLGLPYASWAQSGVLFYLQSSLWSSDLPLTYLCSVLWGFPLPCLLATTILDSFSLFYLPNIPPSRDGRPNSLGIGASRSFWLLPAELGKRGVLGLPLVLVSSLRVLIVVSI